MRSAQITAPGDYVRLIRTTTLDFMRAARDESPVSGLTHNHYRYPARFSPKFVRAAIEAFTEPGDLVLDPFCGGGTTLVEALSLGRKAIGIDISTLATFISEAKTLLMTDAELASVRRWSRRVRNEIHMHAPSIRSSEWADCGYYRNINSRHLWRMRKAIEQALAPASCLRSPRAEQLARSILLRTAQWALDSRKRLPSIAEFRLRLEENAEGMLEAASAFRDAVYQSHGSSEPLVRCIASSAAMVSDATFNDLPAPKLVLTSPPYPGVHVLYHRWQVDGRKEAPAPFWIASQLDGSGSSYYTMGDRKYPELRTYFDNLHACLKRVTQYCDESSVFVQVIGFSEPSWQLPRYLEVAKSAGLREILLPEVQTNDGRIWRTVPNRRWHADQLGHTNGSQEVVLIHQLRQSNR